MPNAGSKLRAADLAWRADAITLPDNTIPAAANTWEDWGDTLVFSNPGTPVMVLAWGCCSVVNDGDGTFGSMRLGISLDGGTTWSYGAGPRDQSGAGASTRRCAVSCQHFVSESNAPSGELVIKAQIQSSVVAADDPHYYYGRVMALVIPQ